jgi:hypothetical protein
VRDCIAEQGISVLFARKAALNRIARTRETESYSRKEKKSAFELPLEYYLDRFTLEECKLFRPLGFCLAAESLVERYEETVAFRACWKVERKTDPKTGKISVKRSWDSDVFQTKLANAINKHWPELIDSKEEDSKEHSKFLERRRTRTEIKERLSDAASDADEAFDMLANLHNEVVPKINI